MLLTKRSIKRARKGPHFSHIHTSQHLAILRIQRLLLVMLLTKCSMKRARKGPHFSHIHTSQHLAILRIQRLLLVMLLTKHSIKRARKGPHFSHIHTSQHLAIHRIQRMLLQLLLLAILLLQRILGPRVGRGRAGFLLLLAELLELLPQLLEPLSGVRVLALPPRLGVQLPHHVPGGMSLPLSMPLTTSSKLGVAVQVVQDVRLQGGQVVELVVLVRRGVAAVGGGVEERVVVGRRVLGQGRLVRRQQRAQGVVVVVAVAVVVDAAVGWPGGGGGGGGPGPQRTAGALRGVPAADAAAGAVLGEVLVWAVPPTSTERLLLVMGLFLTRPGSRSRRIRPVLAAVVGGRAQVPSTTTTTSAAATPTLGGGDVEVAVPGCGARARGVPETVHHVVQLVPRVAQRPPAAVAAVVGRFRRRPHPSQRPAVPVPVPASVPTPVVGRAVVRRRLLEGARGLLRRLPGATGWRETW